MSKKKDEVLDEEVKEENIEEKDAEFEALPEEEADALIELKKMYDEKEKEAADFKDKYMRNLAEYDNFRKRSQKEKSDMFDKGIMETVNGFLDIMDNFDRALQGLNKDELDEKSKSFADGIEMIRKQFDKTLDTIGVSQIEAVGNEFDPTKHNAVQHCEDENAGDNIVVEEYQKGYMYNDKVIRYSMVKVAN